MGICVCAYLWNRGVLIFFLKDIDKLDRTYTFKIIIIKLVWPEEVAVLVQENGTKAFLQKVINTISYSNVISQKRRRNLLFVLGS